MDAKTLDKIRSMAGATKTAAVSDAIPRDLIEDLIKGAAQNPRLKHVELGGALANAGFSQLDVAKTAGALWACRDAGLSVKEASETLRLTEDTIQAVAVVGAR